MYVPTDWDVLGDHAAATWRRRDGRVFWTACMPNGAPENFSEIDQGTCDTIEQAQAAAEAALLAEGYEFEKEVK